jgi:hypothetical protein
MGTRGRRSVADLSAYRPNLTANSHKPIDIPALAKERGTSKREAERFVRRAERHGQAVRHTSRDGDIEWFWTGWRG